MRNVYTAFLLRFYLRISTLYLFRYVWFFFSQRNLTETENGLRFKNVGLREREEKKKGKEDKMQK